MFVSGDSVSEEGKEKQGNWTFLTLRKRMSRRLISSDDSAGLHSVLIPQKVLLQRCLN